jgi:tetratricopeptide (TPR) repeat protein
MNAISASNISDVPVILAQPAPGLESDLRDRRRLQARARRLARRAEDLAGLGKYDEAIACQSEVVVLRPDDCFAFLRLGLLYREVHCIENALSAFRNASKLDPDLSDPREALIETLLEAGRYRETITEAKALVRVSPRNIFARDVLSVAYLQVGDLERAQHMTTEMVRLDPLNPGHHFKRALLFQQEENISACVAEYERARDLAMSGTELHEDAVEALEALDDMQLRQIFVLAAEDLAFRIALIQETREAVTRRGFALTVEGFGRARHFAVDFASDISLPRETIASRGGAKYYN